MSGIRPNRKQFIMMESETFYPLERHRCRWEKNIKIDLEETRWEGSNLLLRERVPLD
jgi:hypothetical protein